MDCPTRTADYGYFPHEEHSPMSVEDAINEIRYGSFHDGELDDIIDNVVVDLFDGLTQKQLKDLLVLMLDSKEFSEIIQDRVADYVFSL